ncbi:hypothetical protein EC973_000759 [Apophysomyces ossiformis]|uniref:Arrestin C-terminal-like domain-containing protein n=1 Tax=Apophysomyces ossiformis TaxID=679940 RepID=A0A8H7EMY2_9FUNG|nr:hypothetical protein EC973_000759 [Apophysomyces ossiformis]
MELDKKKAWIRYTLTAIHGRPMVPETLCSKAEYNVPILEFIDVTSPRYSAYQEKTAEMSLPKAKPDQHCQIRVSIPRLGFTRGEIIPVNLVLTHYQEFQSKQAIQVDLLRVVDIRTAKSTVVKEQVLRSIKHDLHIVGPYNFSHSNVSQLLIPTSTPPTISYKGQMLHVHYKVRVHLNMSTKKKPKPEELCDIEVPIVIGTWPRADVPIDDDDDELDGSMGELMLGEDTEDDISDKDFFMDGSKTPELLKQRLPSNRSSIGFASTGPHGVVDRSSSITSHSSNISGNSESSWISGLSSDHASRITSSTTISSGSDQSSIRPSYARNSLSAGTQLSETYLNRSNSTPDLLTFLPTNQLSVSTASFKPPLPPRKQPDTSLSSSTKRSSCYDNGVQSNFSSQSGISTHQHSKANPPPVAFNALADLSTQKYQHVRVKSDDYRLGFPSLARQSAVVNNVPVHILKPIPSVSTSHSSTTSSRHAAAPDIGASRQPTKSLFQTYSHSSGAESKTETEAVDGSGSGSDVDSDDSEDETDLLHVLAKKKKEQERYMRRKQQMV